MWDITHLHYQIGQAKLLTDINLTVPTGARFGIIGPNGSGKTTLLRHMYGELPVLTGDRSATIPPANWPANSPYSRSLPPTRKGNSPWNSPF